jgi:hypothetical protein
MVSAAGRPVVVAPNNVAVPMVYPQTIARFGGGATMNPADSATASRESLTSESIGVQMTEIRQPPMTPPGNKPWMPDETSASRSAVSAT